MFEEVLFLWKNYTKDGREYLTGKIEWADPEKVVTGTLASAARFQAPNGGMTYWIASN